MNQGFFRNFRSSVIVALIAVMVFASAALAASNSLDFDEFEDALDLDADTTVTGGLFALTFDHASVSGTFEAALVKATTLNFTNASGSNLEISGFSSSSQVFGSGLSDCDGTTAKLLWNAATGLFSCGIDLTEIGSSAIGLREGFTGAFTNFSSISFNAPHFVLDISNPDARLSLDWGSGGPASLSQNETVTGAWTFSTNPAFAGGARLVTSNSLDFDEFENAMTLDADTSIASAGFNTAWLGNFFHMQGNVGIGTTDPDAKLDVAGSILVSTSGNVDLILQSTTAASDESLFRVRSVGSSERLDFMNQSTALVSIASTGHVGVGTTNPIGVVHFVSDGPSGASTREDYKVFYGESSDGRPLFNLKSHGGIGIGYNAGNNSNAADLVAIGWNAGASLQNHVNGNDSVFVGAHAGQNTTSGKANVYVGELAGNLNTTGSYNVAIGEEAGGGVAGATTYSSSVFLGAYAGRINATGGSNVAIGYLALSKASASSNNVAIGVGAGGYINAVTGSQNVSVGTNAGANMSSGAGNVLLGYLAGSPMTTGTANVFVGRQIGQFGSGGITGSNNVILGEIAGYSLKAGQNNTIVGAKAGRFITSGSRNILIGNDLANSPGLTVGTDNILIGNSTVQLPAATSSSRLNIGNLIYGDLTTNKLVGINTVTPVSPLDITNASESALTLSRNDTVVNANDLVGRLDFWNNDSNITNGNNLFARIESRATQAITGNAAGYLSFMTASTSLKEHMRIDAAGNVGINKTVPTTTLDVTGNASISGNIEATYPTIPTTANALCNGTGGVIAQNNTTTCLVSSLRYKHDIQDLDAGLDELMQLRPVSFMPNGFDVERLGFIAEEVHEVEPRLVFFEQDGVTPRGVEYQELTALLTKALQEQQVQIEALQAGLAQGLSGEEPEHEPSIIARIRGYFEDALLAVRELVASRVTTDELEMVDGATGERYCVRIMNGDWEKTAGGCDEDTLSPEESTEPSPSATSEEATPIESHAEAKVLSEPDIPPEQDEQVVNSEPPQDDSE